MRDDTNFLGTGWGFPPSFDHVRRSATLVSNEEDIVQSLWILFGTTPGERVMQPSYGCDLKFMVFEDISESLITDLKDAIERAIRFFEVRVTLNDVTVDDSDWLNGVLRLGIDYTIRSTNTRNNIVYPLYLREGSGVGGRA